MQDPTRTGEPPEVPPRKGLRRVPLLGRVAAIVGALAALAVGVTLALPAGHAPARHRKGRSRHTSPTHHTSVQSLQPYPVDKAIFQPGACIAFPPTHGDRHLTVFLDAGHGGRDPGAIGRTRSGRTVHEANLTLPVELATARLLRSDGFRVVVSRTRSTAVAPIRPGDMSGGVYTVAGATREIALRDVCANLAHASLLVGIYFDAGSSPLDAGSVTGYDRARPFWRANLRFAHLLQHDVLAAMNAHGWGIPNDGVTRDVYLGGPALSAAGARYDHLVLLGPAMAGYFTTPSKMPGALIEPLFVTDPFEASVADSAVGQRVIANGIAAAVRQYFAR